MLFQFVLLVYVKVLRDVLMGSKPFSLVNNPLCYVVVIFLPCSSTLQTLLLLLSVILCVYNSVKSLNHLLNIMSASTQCA